MIEMTEEAAATAGATLASLLIQGQQAQALIVAAQLGIADQLADEPRRAEELAAAIGAHSPALYRLLRALASLGVLAILDFIASLFSQDKRFEESGGPVGLRSSSIWKEYHYGLFDR